MLFVLQISLREGCKKILVSDCYHLLEKLVRVQKKGIYVDGKPRNVIYLFLFSCTWSFDCNCFSFIFTAVLSQLCYFENMFLVWQCCRRTSLIQMLHLYHVLQLHSNKISPTACVESAVTTQLITRTVKRIFRVHQIFVNFASRIKSRN